MIEADYRVPIAAFVAGGVFASIYLVWFCYRPASLQKTGVKTLSVALLAIACLLFGGPWWLTVALCACALGDCLLALDRDRAFLAGVGAFAVGHVFYIYGFLNHPLFVPEQLFKAPFLLIAVLLVILAAGMAVILFRYAGALRFAVVCYVPVIAGLGIAALTLSPQGAAVFALYGALCFLASDFVLALEMFVLRAGGVARKISPFFIWGMYWCAQALLLLGLAAPVK